MLQKWTVRPRGFSLVLDLNLCKQLRVHHCIRASLIFKFQRAISAVFGVEGT